MKMKIMPVPQYPELDILAKTKESVTGTIDRKPISRCLITTEAVEGLNQVVDGDGTHLKHVDAIESTAETELWVELVGGLKSLASFKFFGGFNAADTENPDVIDLYTEEDDKVERLVACANRMCADHSECDGQWKIVDKDGKRYFLRKIDKSLTDKGIRK